MSPQIIIIGVSSFFHRSLDFLSAAQPGYAIVATTDSPVRLPEENPTALIPKDSVAIIPKKDRYTIERDDLRVWPVVDKNRKFSHGADQSHARVRPERFTAKKGRF